MKAPATLVTNPQMLGIRWGFRFHWEIFVPLILCVFWVRETFLASVVVGDFIVCFFCFFLNFPILGDFKQNLEFVPC